MKRLVFILISGLVIVSCKKDTKAPEPIPEPVADYGTVKVSFKNMVDTLPLIFGNTYKNPNGDTMTINMFKYYISNVVLTKADGSKYTEAESYHLINHGNASTLSFTSSNIPAGTYKSISYIIGVDSTRNVSGAQDGDLKQSLGMFWNWNTGYIMLKLEGNSPQAGSTGKTISFHIGGFSGANNVLKKVTINFAQDLVIASNKNPELKLKTNVNEMFKSPNLINFQTTYGIMIEGAPAVMIANNYADMMSYDSIVP